MIENNRTDVLHLRRAKRIGLMGGTFDPIHHGHLVTAESARSEFSLDMVVFVPSGRPPHKKGMSITAPEHRYIMTILATSANPFFEVSRVELDRPGESYAIDTVRHFRKLMEPGSELFFITGADAILEILTWKDVEELFENCTFIAATRPGFDLNQLKKKLSSKVSQSRLEKVIPVEVPAMAISSTDIRERVRNNRSIKYLLPETVENYIFKNDLYRK